MPLTSQTDVQQYSAVVAGTKNVCPTPAVRPVQNAKARNYLLLQNNGENACEVRFGQPCVGDSNSYLLQAGTEKEFRDPCPVNSVNLRCNIAGGTTVTIIEGKEL